MSPPVSENGIFLNDRARVKKALLEEKRLLRLKQVRQESKNLARRIRNDVAAEKQRQLRNLQAIKEQELELWRRSMLSKKYGDYRAAIFHVGDAHAAARAENEAREAAVEARRLAPQESLFHKQIRARSTYGKYNYKKSNITTTSTAPHILPAIYATYGRETNKSKKLTKFQKNSETVKTPASHDAAVQVNEVENSTQNSSGKRKRYSRKNNADDSDNCDSDTSSCCGMSHCTLSDEEKENEVLGRQKLVKTDPIILDIDSDLPFGPPPKRPMEIKDNFVLENRQFSHIIRDSPEKNLKSKPTKQTQNIPKRFSKVTDVLERESKTIIDNSDEPTTAAVQLKTAPIAKYREEPTTARRTTVPPRISKGRLASNTQTKKLSTVRESAEAELKRIPRLSVPAAITTTTTVTPRSTTTSLAATVYNTTRPAQVLPVTTTQPSVQTENTAVNEQQKQKLAIFEEEREKACRDLQLLTDRLDVLAKACFEPIVKDTNITKNAETYRKEIRSRSTSPTIPRPSEGLERPTSAPATPVVKKTVDRASSPTNIQNVHRASSPMNLIIPKATKQAEPKAILRKSKKITITNTNAAPTSKGETNENAQKVARKPTRRDTNVQSVSVEETSNNENKSPRKSNMSAEKNTNDENVTTRRTTRRDSTVNKATIEDARNKEFNLSSVLLEYILDQSKLLRKDLNAELISEMPNLEKCEKLQKLFERNEVLRQKLIEQLDQKQVLKNGKLDKEQIKCIMNDACEVRKQRERVFNDFLTQPHQLKDQSLKLKEKELQQKEEILAQQLKQLLQLQQLQLQQQQIQQQPQSDKVNAAVVETVQPCEERPVEIVITVKGAKPLESSELSKNNNLQFKLTASECSNLQRKALKKAQEINCKCAPKENLPTTQTKEKTTALHSTPKPIVQTEQTYDSQSTHYNSLPKQLNIPHDKCSDEEDDATLANVPSAEEEAELLYRDSVKPSICYYKDPKTLKCINQTDKRVDDTAMRQLMTQYVDRLLSMRRSSIRALGVSSSDVETPSTSIMNTTNNQKRIADELRESQREITRVQRFIAENQSFVEELEKTLCSQRNESLEKSMQLVEQMWKEYLQHENKSRTKETKQMQKPSKKMLEKESKNAKTQHENLNRKVSLITTRDETPQLTNRYSFVVKSARPENVPEKTNKKKKSPRDKSPVVKFKEALCKTVHQITGTFRKSRSPSPENSSAKHSKPKEIPTSSKSIRITLDPVTENTVQSPETRARFAELSTGCTQRIEEFSNMLTRVREEKQRIIESTLSSVSLPSPEGTTRTSRALSRTQESVQQHSADVENDEEPSTSSLRALPDRNAAIGGSLDSGIGISRPVTRQEQPAEEPDSLVIEAPVHNVRHGRPPPVLRRFSPQFEDDAVAHELSTIAEVDTPITSRLNTGVTSQLASNATEVNPPAPFPSFTQYLQAQNLDLTRLDPELSFQLEQQYTELVKVLKTRDSQGLAHYTQFPALTSYLQQMTQTSIRETSVTICENSQRLLDEQRVEELINCLRLVNTTIKKFPTPREYVKIIEPNSTDTGLLETASLENLSSSDSNSDTMNIEQELRNRKLLASACISEPVDMECANESITSKHKSKSPRKVPLNTSNNTKDKRQTVELTDDNFGVGNWVNTMRRRIQETNALCSGSSPSPERNVFEKTKKTCITSGKSALQANTTSTSVGDDTLGSLREGDINLNDFLKRELRRYINTTSTGSSSATNSIDLSFRQQFVQSILDSMTPKTQPSNGAEAAPPASRTTPSTLQGISSSLSEPLSSFQYAINKTQLTRQKTSTPVATEPSSKVGNGIQDTTTNSSDLFSCESRISNVANFSTDKKKRDRH